jgi:hypothetical protein
MPSKARIALKENLQDVKRLLELHAQKGGDAPGRRYGLEVLNKSAIVLITSYWEAYCEDIAEEALEHIVAHAKTSDALPKEIRKLIAKELKANSHELAIWDISDDKWRDFLKKRLQDLKENRNRKLNTPKHKNIDDLFNSAIGLPNVSSKWVWAKKLTAQKAGEKLDKYVELRGEIAHRGKANTSVKKAQVEDFLDFIKKTAAKTGGAVYKHVQSITGKKLWD